MKLFEEADILERHDFGDGRARYEEAPEEHHDHLIDVNSGEVIEFRNDEIERLQRFVAKELGLSACRPSDSSSMASKVSSASPTNRTSGIETQGGDGS